MRRMITQTASALLALLLLFGLAACGSKPQDGTGRGDVASIPADGSTGKGVLAGGRQPDKDMSAAPDEGTEQEALAWLREFMAETSAMRRLPECLLSAGLPCLQILP